jgi:hypothetical protein
VCAFGATLLKVLERSVPFSLLWKGLWKSINKDDAIQVVARRGYL